MLSGVLKTNNYDGRYYQLKWSAKQSIANNTSVISWELQALGGNSGYYYEHSLSLAMYGANQYSSTNSQPRYKGKVADGNFTVNHDANGEATFSIDLKVACYTYSVNLTASATGITLDTIPRKATITSAPDFNDEDNPVIKYNNPAGSAVTKLEASIAISNGAYAIANYREIPLAGTYTFNLDDTEREAIRNATKNSKDAKVKFFIRTTIGSNTFSHSVERKVSVINCAPTFTVTTTPDSRTMQVTGYSPKTFIKQFTDITYKITATALKGASIVEYKAVCGNQTSTTSTGLLTQVQSPVIIYTVKDSRGNIATQTVEGSIIDYKDLTCNLVVDVPTTDGNTAIHISGNYSDASFGSVTNALKLQYRYTDNSGYDSGWIDVSNQVDKNSGTGYSCDINISGLDYTKRYEFEAKAIDALNNVNTEKYPVKTVPVFDWSEDDFNFNVPVTITDGSKSYHLLGALKAMTTAYNLSTTASAGSNYSSASGGATLVGNTLRVQFSGTRKTATGTGDITNETICTLSVKHGGKIKSSYNVGYINGSSGAVASFTTSTNTGSDTLTIGIVLSATTAASTTFSGFFAIPVILNLDKY